MVEEKDPVVEEKDLVAEEQGPMLEMGAGMEAEVELEEGSLHTLPESAGC